MTSLFQLIQRAFQVTWICLRHLSVIAVERMLGRSGIAGPERLRLLLEDLSGSFLKFGQILSLQVDALPRAYCDALLNLLDRVPPFAADQVRQIFMGDMGKPPESLYKEFDYTTLASASIGQVHKAVLPDSTVVAVKVQRPGIREIFRRDTLLLNAFVRIVFLLRIKSMYFMRDPVREFNDWILDELDYRREASYAEVLGRNSIETPSEKVPRIHWQFTSERILTLDFLEGYSVMEYLRLVESGNRQRLAELENIGFVPSRFVSNVINNFLSDAFKFGVFHADLHPANLLIMKNNVVGYVDFGIVGSMTPEARRKQIQLSLAYVRGKTEEIYNAFLNVCTITEGADLPGFRRELERRSRFWYREPAIGGVTHFSRSLTIAMIDLLTLCRFYGLLVDREMIKYIRSLFLADGLVSRLAPGLDLAPQIRKLCEDFITREAQGKMLSRGAALTFLVDISGWLLAGPGRMLNALELLERRQLRFQTRSERRPGHQEGLRIQALFAGLVWMLVALVVFNARQGMPFGSSVFEYIAFGFWGAWTLWTAYLLKRLI
ncbi:MAG TPA: AarF/UbiB family protein [Acidobacteriota bacterium]|nr:AarF/UbiB family protein [Acidobacteriota bacterium]